MSKISLDQERARDQLYHNYSLGRGGNKEHWSDYIEQSDLAGFKKDAYASNTGYSIRVNPHTGYKEMFIAGSDDIQDWVSNVVEGLSHIGMSTQAGDLSEAGKIKFANHLQSIAEKEGVDVVYGHSRGVSIMSYMEAGHMRIGLDGASVIGARSHYVNLDGTSLFDRMISAGHKENVVLTNRIFHDVTTTKKQRTKASKNEKAKAKHKSKRTKAKHTDQTRQRLYPMFYKPWKPEDFT